MTSFQETYPLLHQGLRSDDTIPTEPYHSSCFIGDIEEVRTSDGEEEEDTHVSVGLSQVTLFPSRKLKREVRNRDVPDRECVLLSMCSLCLDDDQMLALAHYTDAYQQEQNNGKKKSYVPPPVTWSQPVIIVPPEEPVQEDYETNPNEGGNQVKFEDSNETKVKGQKMILLHGRVARALGIKNGDKVTVQLEGQTKRMIVRASVDDRASFNVVLEADWLDILTNSTSLAGGKYNSHTNREALLRSVDLKVDAEKDEWGDSNRNARFYLTPCDLLREGILYFEGSLVANHPRHNHGLVAGTGFCIYSCAPVASTTDGHDDSSSESSVRPEKNDRLKLPRNKTELVSSFRYLGRPFCPNHAEYSALIEGLEWLFRFQFDKVYIAGAPKVVNALRKPLHPSEFADVFENEPASSDDDDEKCDVKDVPQLQRANNIARGMIDKAEKQLGIEIRYLSAGDDESWVAGELADKAIDEGRNATHVLWDNIREAQPLDPKYYRLHSSFAYSEDSSPHVKRMESEDEWSLLRGEDVLDVLDEEFQLLDSTAPTQPTKSEEGSHDDPEKLCPTESKSHLADTPARLQDCADESCSTKRTSHFADTPTMPQESPEGKGSIKRTNNLVPAGLPTNADEEKGPNPNERTKHLVDPQLKADQEVEVPFDEKNSYIFATGVVETDDEREDPQKATRPEDKKKKHGLTLQGLRGPCQGSHGGRWQKLAKAARHRRLLRGKAEANTSDTANGDDDRSTWMLPPPSPSPNPNSKDNLTRNVSLEDGCEEEKETEFSDDEARILNGTSSISTRTASQPDKGDATNSSVSNSMCFMMDLEFIKGVKVVADDVARIFVGSRQKFRFDDEEEKTSSPLPTHNKISRSPPPPVTVPSPSRSLIDPPPPKRLAPSRHYEESLSPSPPAPLLRHHRKQYAYV